MHSCQTENHFRVWTFFLHKRRTREATECKNFPIIIQFPHYGRHMFSIPLGICRQEGSSTNHNVHVWRKAPVSQQQQQRLKWTVEIAWFSGMVPVDCNTISAVVRERTGSGNNGRLEELGVDTEKYLIFHLARRPDQGRRPWYWEWLHWESCWLRVWIR